jgi:predicted aconitase with swiveling domain
MNAISFTGSCVVEGIAEGEALVSEQDIALAMLDPATGVIKDPYHPLSGQCVTGKVLVFPNGSGSSSGSYRLLHLAEQRTAPAGIINRRANAVVTAGAVLGNIPLVHRLVPDPIGALVSGDWVRMDAGKGMVVARRDGKP